MGKRRPGQAQGGDLRLVVRLPAVLCPFLADLLAAGLWGATLEAVVVELVRDGVVRRLAYPLLRGRR